MTILKINLNDGLLEVDGEEDFVRSIYSDFKTELIASRNANPAPVAKKPDQDSTVKKSSSTKKSSNGKKRESFTILKDLDLSSKTNSLDLKNFLSDKAPITAMERNTVFVYYLKNHANASVITLDHIYSCYKYTSTPVPAALRQSIADTSSRRGWLDTSSFDDIKLSIPGENYVEHDLPRKGN